LKVLDIGGGFKTNTDLSNVGNQLEIFKHSYMKGYPDHYPLRKNPLEIWIEPGRFFSEVSFDLVVQVIAKKQGENSRTYIINDGIYHSFSNMKYDHWEFPSVINTNSWNSEDGSQNKSRMFTVDSENCNMVDSELNNGTTLFNSTICGPTCDWNDIITKNAYIPELNIGDYIVFKGMGAYSYVSNSGFNDIITGKKFFE